MESGVVRRFDSAFFTALGIVLMLRTLTYVDTVAAVRVGIGVELNPFAQLNTIFVAGSDIILVAAVILPTILFAHKEIRVVGYSFIVALVSADLAWDLAQYLELPPANLALSQVYAVVWGVTAIIPLTVGVWQIEGLLTSRTQQADQPLNG